MSACAPRQDGDDEKRPVMRSRTFLQTPRRFTIVIVAMSYPTHRPRRLRTYARAARLVPRRVRARQSRPAAVRRPGTRRRAADRRHARRRSALGRSRRRGVRAVHDLGIPAVILFGIPEQQGRDRLGGVRAGRHRVQRGRARSSASCRTCSSSPTSASANTPTTATAASSSDGEIANDPTVEQLVARPCRTPRAGADIVAPSDMMDGRVGAIRAALDERGFERHRRSWPTRRSTLGVLRAVPRRRGVGAAVRRPARLPDGPGERRRGAARGRARHRGRRRHRHGEAGARLSRRHPSREGALRRADSPPTR